MKEALIDQVETLKETAWLKRVCTGTIVDIDNDGRVLVDFTGNTHGPTQAYYTNAFKTQIDECVGIIQKKVLLVFDNDELEMPIIVDTLHSKIDNEPEPLGMPSETVDDVVVDGKKITFKAVEEITLKCGKATIQLTKAGKIIIRGAYLFNRSSGVNRIKGGSVQIN